MATSGSSRLLESGGAGGREGGIWTAQPSAYSLSPFHPLLHCSCPAAPSSARRLTSAARSAREPRPHERREGGGQYGEAPRPHERREIKVQQRPIRRGAATARAPRGPGAEAANTASGACQAPYGLRGVLDLAPTPPTRAGPPPVRRPHPHHQAPQRCPRVGVASEDFQGAAQGWRFWQLCSDDAVGAQLARFQHEEEDDLIGSSTSCLFCFSVASYSINTEHYARKSAAAIVQESNYCMNSEHLQRNCCSFGSMPEAGLTDSPLFLHPQQVQINTEAPCRSQRLAKYNTTTSF
ncbi:uncharacterized protein [Triticum aestivum]|uniref:uncharacterized protein n=1 Tax=Triticum aestivum TaxID=4565 RepID=UPI001D035111|nr:uncharacterized protein LOC123078036 [Triticum aestivum]